MPAAPASSNPDTGGLGNYTDKPQMGVLAQHFGTG